ncbi:RfaG Glycosyltransferase [Flavobacteriaceae bacterium]
MKLLIVSAAPFIYKRDNICAYSPYVNELVIWNKFASEIIFCCPVWKSENGLLVTPIPFSITKHLKIYNFNISSISNIFKAFFYSLNSIYVLFIAMQQADHIHLRCPGNIGLLGCLVQILFPNKQKSAKYAGNWDPKSKQPLTYKLQKFILSSTFLTKNIQVLVYGEWEGSTKNIKPFFTASYYERDKTSFDFLKKQKEAHVNELSTPFLFVGTLSKGKQPLYAVQLVEQLQHLGNKVHLDLYGDGIERSKLEKYILENNLKNCITLHGNKTAEEVQKAYQESSFLVLPSKSEGWPKVVAEAMFWGCLPIASAVSCVPNMLDSGNRGIILTINLEEDVHQINVVLNNSDLYQCQVESAVEWSRTYTLDYFEQEIKEVLQKLK